PLHSPFNCGLVVETLHLFRCAHAERARARAKKMPVATRAQPSWPCRGCDEAPICTERQTCPSRTPQDVSHGPQGLFPANYELLGVREGGPRCRSRTPLVANPAG